MPNRSRFTVGVFALLSIAAFAAVSAVIARPDPATTSGAEARDGRGVKRGGEISLIEDVIFDLDGDGTQESVDREVCFDPASPAYSCITIRSSATGFEIASVVGPELNDMFGWSVAPFPDIDGDGVAELAVAAPRAPVGADFLGRVYILSGLTREVLLDCAQAHQAGFLGLGILAVQDTDLDGSPDLLICGARPTGQSWVDESGITVVELIPSWAVASSATGQAIVWGDGNPPVSGSGARQLLAWREVWSGATPAGNRDWLTGWSADLDASGAVNIADIVQIIQHFGREASRWVRGDADLSGFIDFDDITLAIAQSGSLPPARIRARVGAGIRGGWIEGGCGDTRLSCPTCEFDLPIDCEPPGGGEPPPCEGLACDADNDGTPDVYDCDSPSYVGPAADCADDDNDGIPNVNDPHSGRYNPLHPDSDADNDGIPNKDDDDFFFRDEAPWGLNPDPNADDNGDGVLDINDPFSPRWDKRHPNSDPDRDGLNNDTDSDNDNDGIPDINDGDPYQPIGTGGTGPAVCRTEISGPSGAQLVGQTHYFYAQLADCAATYDPDWTWHWGTTGTLVAELELDEVHGRLVVRTIQGTGWLTVRAQGKDSSSEFPDSRPGVFSVRVVAGPPVDPPPAPACSVAISGCPPEPGIVVLTADGQPVNLNLAALASDPNAAISWIAVVNGQLFAFDGASISLPLSLPGIVGVICIAAGEDCVASASCVFSVVCSCDSYFVVAPHYIGAEYETPIRLSCPQDGQQCPLPIVTWSVSEGLNYVDSFLPTAEGATLIAKNDDGEIIVRADFVSNGEKCSKTALIVVRKYPTVTIRYTAFIGCEVTPGPIDLGGFGGFYPYFGGDGRSFSATSGAYRVGFHVSSLDATLPSGILLSNDVGYPPFGASNAYDDVDVLPLTGGGLCSHILSPTATVRATALATAPPNTHWCGSQPASAPALALVGFNMSAVLPFIPIAPAIVADGLFDIHQSVRPDTGEVDTVVAVSGAHKIFPWHEYHVAVGAQWQAAEIFAPGGGPDLLALPALSFIPQVLQFVTP